MHVTRSRDSLKLNANTLTCFLRAPGAPPTRRFDGWELCGARRGRRHGHPHVRVQNVLPGCGHPSGLLFQRAAAPGSPFSCPVCPLPLDKAQQQLAGRAARHSLGRDPFAASEGSHFLRALLFNSDGSRLSRSQPQHAAIPDTRRENVWPTRMRAVYGKDATFRMDGYSCVPEPHQGGTPYITGRIVSR